MNYEIAMALSMAALVGLVFVVSMIMVRRRIAATKARTVDLKSFVANQFADDAPLGMLQAGRNFANLFETPVLFFVVVLAVLHFGLADRAFVGMAWMYVVLRVIHSYIHLGYNNLRHRLGVFVLSYAVILSMWIWLVAKLLGKG